MSNEKRRVGRLLVGVAATLFVLTSVVTITVYVTNAGTDRLGSHRCLAGVGAIPSLRSAWGVFGIVRLLVMRRPVGRKLAAAAHDTSRRG